MTSAVAAATSFKDLLEVGADGPYVFTQMFSNDDRKARSRSKRTFKLLKGIDAALRSMLREGERVFFVTRGVARPSVLEWYFLGAPLYYMNQRAIVLTSHRVLLIQINSRRKPKEMRNEISYAAVKEVSNSWTGTTKVEFQNGGKVLLTGIPKADRRWLKDTFDKLLSRLEAPPEQSELENLCPHCYVRVEGRPRSCSSCGGYFKSPRTAALLSFVYPGAGDLYLGHRGFAVLELLGATILWLVIGVMAFAPEMGVLEASIVTGFFIAFAHGGDALTTRMIARKGIMPDAGRPLRARFAAAAVVPLVGITSIALAAPSKMQLRPEPGIVSGQDMAEAHRAALVEAGYVEPDETIGYFYSFGPATVLQDGSLFTEERIVSYEATVDGTFHQAARFEDVVDIRMGEPPSDAVVAQVYVVTEEDGAFLLFVGTEGGGDEIFLDELRAQWRTARAGTPGYWFDGGDGASPGDAILVHGAATTAALDAAAGAWLTTWFGEEATDWTLRERLEHDASIEYRIDLLDGPRTFHFTAAQ